MPISGWNAKRTVFGTIDIETGRRTFVVRAGICAPDFHETLRTIREAYGDRKVVLLLDKASRHTAHSSKVLAADLNIQLIWLPARSTNINPMDRPWRRGKDKESRLNTQHPDINPPGKQVRRVLVGPVSARGAPEGWDALGKVLVAAMRSWGFWTPSAGPCIRNGRHSRDLRGSTHHAPTSPTRSTPLPPPDGTFVAIDFETADHGPDSACAVGVVRVEGMTVVRRESSLIRPPRSRILFTHIHGITWEMVKEAARFADAWN